MIPPSFDLDFTMPPVAMHALVLDMPPTLVLTPPDAGWIRLTLTGQANGKAVNAKVRLSNVFPPLADLWLWSRVIAANLAPARVRIDEEGIASEWRVEPMADDGLYISLVQEDSEGQPHTFIAWHEPRAGFLAHWGSCFAALFHDDSLPWEEWEGRDDEVWPEPARGLPWDKLAQTVVETPSNWSRDDLIVWFWLLHAHYFHPGRTNQITRNNEISHAREHMQLISLRIRCAAMAWRVAMPGQPLPDAGRYSEACRDMAEWLEDDEPSLTNTSPALPTTQSVFEHIGQVNRAADDWARPVETTVFARLPLKPGQPLINERHERGVVLKVDERIRIEVWETGAVTAVTGFTHIHSSVWRWPVARDAHHISPLELPDVLACAFACVTEFQAWPVCPCCGYPPLDDDPAEIQSCELCGWPVWKILYNPPPGLDDPGDERLLSLRECRKNFQSHGDIWPLNSPHEEVAHFLSPRSTQARQACLDDWNHWLADPARSADTLPDPVWLREQRMERAEKG
jgi:hypothetical protein